jgi:hypothetical protein
VIEQDEVHGDGDGHVLMMIKLNLKKEEREKKIEMIKAKVYDRFFVLHSRHHKGCE